LVNKDLGQREHWKKVNITIKKNTPTQAALLPSLLKTILTVQLINQLQILFYMELISITTHEQVSKISEFINISKMKLIF
jgi:hypothetical protein